MLVDPPENISPVAVPVSFGHVIACAARISSPAANISKRLASNFGLSPKAMTMQSCSVRARSCAANAKGTINKRPSKQAAWLFLIVQLDVEWICRFWQVILERQVAEDIGATTKRAELPMAMPGQGSSKTRRNSVL